MSVIQVAKLLDVLAFPINIHLDALEEETFLARTLSIKQIFGNFFSDHYVSIVTVNDDA